MISLAANIDHAGQIAATVVYSTLAIFAYFQSERHLHGALFILSCGLTAGWAASSAILHEMGLELGELVSVLELAKGMAWIVFLYGLMLADPLQLPKFLARRNWILGAVIVLAIPFCLVVTNQESDIAADILFLCLSVLALVLIENVYRNLSAQRKWGFKFLFVGLGSAVLYDTILYADQLFLQNSNLQLSQARGAVYALVGPALGFAAHRSKLWRARISLSRQVAFYSTALLVTISSILVATLIALYIRQFGGSGANAVQAIFLFAFSVLLIVFLFSGTVRAYFKVLIGKHFFDYRYDYRAEWLRFTDTVAQTQGSASLEERVVKAIADIVESPSGGMWYLHGDHYAIAGAWNMVLPSLGRSTAQKLAKFLTESEWIVQLDEVKNQPEKYNGFQMPEVCHTIKGAWVIVPLLHHSTLYGFVLLTKPRAPRSIGWEEYDLLKTVGRQAASYLAEQKAGEALAEVREFEKFNRRSAFVVHDIKNLVSQLSLICSNVQRHGEKEEFRKDMVNTVENVVVKMNRMLERLNPDQSVRTAEPSTKLGLMLRNPDRIEWSSGVELHYDGGDLELFVAGDQDRLEALIGHILGNAVEAVDQNGVVRFDVHTANGMAIIEVTDNGPGMERSFVSNEYFKVFCSTKPNGLGLGAFQCRDYARELGGDLTVISTPGLGTTVRICLPIVRDASSNSAEAAAPLL